MCLFAAMAGSLYAFCSVKSPPKAARKEPPPVDTPPQGPAPAPAGRGFFEAPDTVIHDLEAHVHELVEARERAKTQAPPHAEASAAANNTEREKFKEMFAARATARPATPKRPRGRPRSVNQGKKTNGDARKAPPAAPPQA
jgi:hypothetical protein